METTLSLPAVLKPAAERSGLIRRRKSLARASRRPKFDLTPIGVDEALSNPALVGIESTLRNLAGLGAISESPPGADRTNILDQSQRGKSADLVDSPISDTPIGDSLEDSVGRSKPDQLCETSTGDSHICDSHIGELHLETRSSRPPVLGGNESNARSEPLVSPCIEEIDPRLGDIPIGLSSLVKQTPLSEHEDRSIGDHVEPIGVSLIGVSGVHPIEFTETVSQAAASSIVRDASWPVRSEAPHYRQKIREARDVQDGHSNGEQLLYQALWRVGRPETADTRLVTIGYGGMHEIAKLDRSNCKKNILSLIDKLAVEAVGRHSVQRNIGKTYRIYSYSAILRRRKQAGMVFIVRANGVRFVTADGNLLSAQSKISSDLTELGPINTLIGDSHRGVSKKAQGETHIGAVSDPPIGQLGKTHTGPIGEAHRESKEIRNQGTPQEASSSFGMPQELIKDLHFILPTLDDQAAGMLWNECRIRVPDCTPEEVTYFVKTKTLVLKAGRIQNPVGFLISAVPKCFEGETFQIFRREQARRREEQQKSEAEERRRAEELQEQARLEAESYRRAEERLAALPEGERMELHDRVKADLLRDFPQIRNWPSQEAIEDRVRNGMIRELQKRPVTGH